MKQGSKIDVILRSSRKTSFVTYSFNHHSSSSYTGIESIERPLNVSEEEEVDALTLPEEIYTALIGS